MPSTIQDEREDGGDALIDLSKGAPTSLEMQLAGRPFWGVPRYFDAKVILGIMLARSCNKDILFPARLKDLARRIGTGRPHFK